MYLFFCTGEDTGIVGKNGQAILRKKLTIEEIEFMMAVSLNENFRDGDLITLAMPYFGVEEFESMFESMQKWLTLYEEHEKMADVKKYFKNHYEHIYNLVMTPLRIKHG